MPSNLPKFSTRKLSFLAVSAILISLFSAQSAFAQLSGTKSIPGDYATIAAAITDLNTQGVGPGGVTFNIAAGYSETAPVGGYEITATGTLANPIIFQKSGVGANPLITAYAGGNSKQRFTTKHDGIWRMVGTDYLTIDRLSFQENPANTTDSLMMEYAIGFYKTGASNGCQDRKSTRLNSSHVSESRMPSSA